MRIPHSALPVIRTTILGGFLALNLFVFGYFWIGAGGTIPLVSPKDYKVSFVVPTAHNLVNGSHVDLAGVPIGKVESIEPRPDGRADVLLRLTDSAPLHQGVRLHLREKSLLGETYVDVVDGKGKALPDNSRIPTSRVTPAVNLDDVLQKFGKPERAALGGALRSLGAATQGSRHAISDALSGLGNLSREGQTALDALASQEKPLRQLSANTAGVLQALDTRRGQLAQLITDAERVTDVTSGASGQLKQVMRQLPGTLRTAQASSGHLSRLGGALHPVAANLNRAAPSLNVALAQLPATSADLRGLLPSLDQTMIKSPPTLHRVPTVSQDLIELLPRGEQALRNLNPMLAYLRPYGHDIASFFTNFGITTKSNIDGNGTVFRVMPIFVKDTLKNYPLSLQQGPLDTHSGYQKPGMQEKDPVHDQRRFEQLERGPR